jgi:hypothetical protein
LDKVKHTPLWLHVLSTEDETKPDIREIRIIYRDRRQFRYSWFGYFGSSDRGAIAGAIRCHFVALTATNRTAKLRIALHPS